MAGISYTFLPPCNLLMQTPLCGAPLFNHHQIPPVTPLTGILRGGWRGVERGGGKKEEGVGVRRCGGREGKGRVIKHTQTTTFSF